MKKRINFRHWFAEHLIVVFLIFAVAFQTLDVIFNYFFTRGIQNGLVDYYQSPNGQWDIICFCILVLMFSTLGFLSRNVIRDNIKANNDISNLMNTNKQFAYSVIHDVKNPAIGINTMSILLKTKYADILDYTGTHYLDLMEQSSKDLVKLMDSLNEFIQSSEHQLNFETIDVQNELTTIRESMQPMFSAKCVKWLQQPEHFPEIKGDRLSINRIFRNLMDNALNHGGDGLNFIKIEYQETGEWHEFSVCDNGCGINEQETVFDAFKRGKTSGNVNGLGLGLTTVKELVEKHGGAVWMSSVLGRGATFTFRVSKNL